MAYVTVSIKVQREILELADKMVQITVIGKVFRLNMQSKESRVLTRVMRTSL